MLTNRERHNMTNKLLKTLLTGETIKIVYQNFDGFKKEMFIHLDEKMIEEYSIKAPIHYILVKNEDDEYRNLIIEHIEIY